MKKYGNFFNLSKNLFQITLKSEVNHSKILFPKIYSTNTNENNKNIKSVNESVKILSVNDENLSEFNEISLKELTRDIKIPHALDECDEDISDVAPYQRPTFNFARYANKSETIKELVKLGVELWKIEKNPEAMKLILSSKFDDLKPHIQFLHDCGVPLERIAYFITKNPMIFKEDMDDLKTRIRYLRAHNFTQSDIARIVTDAPEWISWPTKEIDNKLAYFQREFKLRGYEIRALVVKRPQIVTHKLKFIRDITFSVREEMGFENEQLKEMLLNKPQIWQNERQALLNSFDYIHGVMEISHERIAKQPSILATKVNRIKERHLFLVSLKRAQYDPKKPLYISLDSLAMGTDIDFCVKTAKASIELFDMFLKTF